MLRLDIDAQAVTVADDRVDQPLVRAARLKQLDALLAVLVRPLLKVDVVQQTDNRPEIGFIAVPQLVCHPTHDVGNGQRVGNMKRLAVILAQQGKCLVISHEKHSFGG